MMTAKLKGRERLAKRMREMPNRVQAELQKAVIDGAEELAALQRRFAPVDDGDLRDSIEVTGPGGTTPKYSQPGGSKTIGPMQAMVTAGNSKVRYAHLVEYGTAPHVNKGQFAGTQNPGTEPQPFFWPAYRLLKKRIRSRIRRGVNKALKRGAGLSR